MYGKCQRCSALAKLQTIGTIDPKTFKPATLQLCAACAPLYLRVNRKARRDIEKGQRQKPRQRRAPDNAPLLKIRQEAAAKRKSPILVPSQRPQPEPETGAPIVKRSKGGIVLP